MTKEKQPEISVIVPVYKVEDYLNKCVDSVLAQTFSELELILVDDGSPDSCPALCDLAAQKDSRVRVIHKPNGGVSTARNAGLDAARGNWITFVDSDDWIAPEMCARLYETAVREAADIAMCDSYKVDEQGDLLGKKQNIQEVFDETLPREEALQRTVLSVLQVPWNKLFRKELLTELRFPEKKGFEDTWLLPKIFEKAQKTVCLSDRLYFYRIRQNSAMHSRISLKSLDMVEADYELFECLLRNQGRETLCIAYRMILTGLIDIWLHLTPEERRTSRMQQCIGYKRNAWRCLRQAHGVTLSAVWDTLVYSVSPQTYLVHRRKRLLVRAEAENRQK